MDLAKPSHFIQIVERIALEDGNRVAIEQGDRAVSYAQLLCVAERLGRQGLTGEKAGILSVQGHPSTEIALAMISGLLHGDIVLPIDGALPEDRKALLADWADTEADLDNISTVLDAVLTAPTPCPIRLHKPREQRDPAYIAFTSGTTGAAKAIEGNYGGLGHFVSWQVSCVERFKPRPRVSWLTPLSFDVMYRDLLLPLCSGGTLVIPEDRAAFNIAEGWDWLCDNQIDVSHVVPSICQAWLARETDRNCTAAALFFAGEPLRGALVEDLRSRFTGRVFNLYGPSETTMAKFVCEITDTMQTHKGSYPVGTPIVPSVDYALADSGEIVIESPFLTNGYRNTDGGVSAFSQGTTSGEAWYSYPSGDRGVVKDGLLYVTGRLDNQFKVNGVRIEAAEIENTALQVAGVKQAVALKLAPPDHRFETTALVYLSNDADDATKSRIQTALSASLHPTVVPTVYLSVDVVPLTPNGKADRGKLKELVIAESSKWLEVDEKDTGTAGEEAVRRAFLDVLRTQAGLDTAFLTVGGNSLMYALIALDLEEAFGARISQADFYERETPRRVAAWFASHGLQLKHSTIGDHDAPAMPLAAKRDLSIQQRTFFNIFCKDWYARSVNMSLVIDIIDEQKAEATVHALLREHDCFQLNFDISDGTIKQWFNPRENLSDKIEHIHCSASDLATTVQGIGRTAFDLFDGHPFRVGFVSDETGRTKLFLTMHHLITDGMSREYIRRYLEDRLAGKISNPKGSFARALALTPKVTKAECDTYWGTYLAAPVNLRRWIARTDADNLSARSMTLRLGAEHAALINYLGHQNIGVFPFAFAAFFKAFSDLSDGTDLIIRTTTHGRNTKALADVLGCVFNSVPMRICDCSKPLLEIAKRVSADLETSQTYQQVAFEELGERLGEEPNEYLHPVTGISFALDGYNVAERMPVGAFEKPVYSDNAAGLMHEMIVFCRTYCDGTVLSFNYRSKAFSDEQVARIAGTMNDIVSETVARCDVLG